MEAQVRMPPAMQARIALHRGRLLIHGHYLGRECHPNRLRPHLEPAAARAGGRISSTAALRRLRMAGQSHSLHTRPSSVRHHPPHLSRSRQQCCSGAPAGRAESHIYQRHAHESCPTIVRTRQHHCGHFPHSKQVDADHDVSLCSLVPFVMAKLLR
jgi:hypothetical protein